MVSGEESPNRGEDIEENDAVRMQFDWSYKNPSTAVAETVAVAANSGLNEMEPLYKHIDPDALDALVSPKAMSRCETTDSVSFEYDVTVLSSGEVSVRKNGSG
jgi:hypothetical protein